MDYVALGLLFAVILVQSGVIVLLILASGNERERLLDRIQAPEASVAAAFAFPRTDQPADPEPDFDFESVPTDPDLIVLDKTT